MTYRQCLYGGPRLLIVSDVSLQGTSLPQIGPISHFQSPHTTPLHTRGQGWGPRRDTSCTRGGTGTARTLPSLAKVPAPVLPFPSKITVCSIPNSVSYCLTALVNKGQRAEGTLLRCSARGTGAWTPSTPAFSASSTNIPATELGTPGERLAAED